MPAIEAAKALKAVSSAMISGQTGRGLRAATISVGTLLSLALHGSVLASFLYWADQKPGAIEQLTEAISLESLQSEVLEAVKPSPSVVAASLLSVETTSGEVAESSAASRPFEVKETHEDRPAHETEVQVTEVEERSSEAEGIDVVRGALDSEIRAGVERTRANRNTEKARKMAHAPSSVLTSETPIQRQEAHPNQKRQSKKKQQSGASVRASKASKRSAGRISASAGSGLNYAAIVRAQVAARKPFGDGDHGTAVVAFSVSGTGALRSARIARSSGNPGLDGRVLAAVRSAAPFPPPPAGANKNFAMPFYFK